MPEEANGGTATAATTETYELSADAVSEAAAHLIAASEVIFELAENGDDDGDSPRWISAAHHLRGRTQAAHGARVEQTPDRRLEQGKRLSARGRRADDASDAAL
jgi:hypothetical protein